MSDPFVSHVNQDNSKVGSHVRFERFVERDRIIIVGYTITRYGPSEDNGTLLEAVHDFVRTRGSNPDDVILHQLVGCVVRVTYAAAIYNEKDWQQQVKKSVSKYLRTTVLDRLTKCPVAVPLVDTHVQAEFNRRNGDYTEGGSVAFHSRKIMHSTLRKLVRKYGVRGDRSGTI